MARAIALPEGWFAREVPERRAARTGYDDPMVEAIVHHRSKRLRCVVGWRLFLGDAGAAGNGEGLIRRPRVCRPCAARERAEDAQRIRAALDILPGRYRQALHLVYFEGHTHSDAAIHLAIPLGTAKAWVRRGLRALREAHASLAPIPTRSLRDASRLVLVGRVEACRTKQVLPEVTTPPG